MESKYTPGPWYYVNYAYFYQIKSKKGYTDSDVLNEEVTDRAEANAKLAAAAPELLEACEQAVKSWEKTAKEHGYSLSKDKDYQRLKAAILKATSI